MIYEESLHMMLLRPRFTTPLQGTKLWGKWVFWLFWWVSVLLYLIWKVNFLVNVVLFTYFSTTYIFAHFSLLHFSWVSHVFSISQRREVISLARKVVTFLIKLFSSKTPVQVTSFCDNGKWNLDSNCSTPLEFFKSKRNKTVAVSALLRTQYFFVHLQR